MKGELAGRGRGTVLLGVGSERRAGAERWKFEGIWKVWRNRRWGDGRRLGDWRGLGDGRSG